MENNAKRQDVVEQVRKWAGPTTDAILDPAMQIFQTSEIEGLIAYRDACGAFVVFGDPTCSEKDKATLAQAFHNFAAEKGNVVIYISASKDFSDWAMKNICKALIEFGQELMIDPFNDPTKETGEHASLLRRKVKHAVNDGVVIAEYKDHDQEMEKTLEEIGKSWLKRRHGPQLHISNVYLFQDRYGKRWFYAKHKDAIVGTISLNLLKAHEGWHLNHLMTTLDAPHGTTELLVISALDILKNEGCRFASFGMVQGSDLGHIEGLSKFYAWVARKGFKLARKIARLEGLNIFWAKFNPQTKPSYLLLSRSRIGLREMRGLIVALSGTTKGE